MIGTFVRSRCSYATLVPMCSRSRTLLLSKRSLFAVPKLVRLPRGETTTVLQRQQRRTVKWGRGRNEQPIAVSSVVDPTDIDEVTMEVEIEALRGGDSDQPSEAETSTKLPDNTLRTILPPSDVFLDAEATAALYKKCVRRIGRKMTADVMLLEYLLGQQYYLIVLSILQWQCIERRINPGVAVKAAGYLKHIVNGLNTFHELQRKRVDMLKRRVQETNTMLIEHLQSMDPLVMPKSAADGATARLKAVLLPMSHLSVDEGVLQIRHQCPADATMPRAVKQIVIDHIESALRNNRPDIAWTFTKEFGHQLSPAVTTHEIFCQYMHRAIQARKPPHTTIPDWVAYFTWCASSRAFIQSYTVGELVFSTFRACYPFDPDCSIWYTKLPANNLCQHCGLTLDPVTFTDDECATLKQIAHDRFNDYATTHSATLPEEMEMFKKFLEKSGKFDVVIDGLNLIFLLLNHEKSLPRSMEQRVETTVRIIETLKQEMGWKNVLIIIRSEVAHFAARMATQGKVFVLQKNTEDDNFVLLAALYHGADTVIISRDKYRNYRTAVAAAAERTGRRNEPELVERWISARHSSIFLGRMKELKLAEFKLIPLEKVNEWWTLYYKPPANCDQRARESANDWSRRVWHIPYLYKSGFNLEGGHKWLCCRFPPVDSPPTKLAQ